MRQKEKGGWLFMKSLVPVFQQGIQGLKARFKFKALIRH